MLSRDPNGNLLTETDANGNITQHSYDPSNRRIRSDHPNGRITHYTYTPTGLLETQQDGEDRAPKSAFGNADLVG